MVSRLLALVALLAAPLAMAAAVELDVTRFPADGQADPIIEMVAEGEGEAVELRLRPEVGLSQIMVMNMTMAGDQMPMEMGMVMEMRSTVTEMRDDGTFTLEQNGLDMRMPDMPGVGAQMGQAFRDLTFVTTMNPRGEVVDSRVEGAPQVQQMLGQSMQGAQFTLPEEAVAPGATWEVRSVVENQGMRLFQTMTYTVTAITDGVIEMDVIIDQRARDQAIQGMQLQSLHTQGSGSMTLDLSRPIPTVASLEMETAMTMNAQGQVMPMNMTIQMDITAEDEAEAADGGE